ncbi:immunoglobulin gamma-1 heavy chain-like [Heptranchias perlo]|uniref:immunoglobulin gamma-1 heavy chain-like n=1 Tax=Heptranchias perlo TaxID=212740 RepID=UPI00355971B1
MSKGAFSLVLSVQIVWVYVADSETFLPHNQSTVTAEIGQTVELLCHPEYEVEFVASYHWYKQRVGEAPRLIDTESCNGTGCRFISKKGDTRNALKLEIRMVQVNDSGLYYCAAKHGAAQLRNGSRLLVGDSSTTKTAVLVFAPLDEIQSRETMPLVCLVSGVSSNEIPIFWNISGLVTEGLGDSGTIDTDGTYSIRSHVFVPRETWRGGGVCTCIVQLGPEGKSMEKSVSHKTVRDWCSQIRPVAITVTVILFLLLILITIWIHKRRSDERMKKSHKVIFKGRRKETGPDEPQSDGNRQTKAKRPHQGEIKPQGGPRDTVLYASLDFAAPKKSAKNKRGRR